MTTLAEFFEHEAGTSLETLRSLLDDPAPDAPAIHRVARTLRGSAQMAREERVYRAALALESAVKPAARAGNGTWTEALLGCVRAAVEDLGVLVDGTDPSPELDGRLRASLERWQAAGVELPGPAVGRRTAGDPSAGMREFRAYAARELDGIAQALDENMRALRVNAADREPLKAILRRQRALRGAARLDEIPVVADILRAVEDLTRVVAKLDVPVRDEWFDVYRTAREGLVAAIPALAEDRDPQPSSALARLRHLRSELLARYGTGEAVNPSASQREGLGQVQTASALIPPLPAPPVAAPRPATSAPKPAAPATPPRPPAPAPTDAPVPIEQLEYHGQAALRQALTLRQGLERAVGEDAKTRELLEELFDLLRLALG
jgi:chemotaxis protein histidine kinase CheA